METLDLKVARKMVSLQSSASSRGFDFDLSFNTVKKLLTEKRCFYTGVVMTDEINTPNQRTIDRVDNTKGYVEGNVVACTKEINSKKSDLTVEEITTLYNKVKKKSKIFNIF